MSNISKRIESLSPEAQRVLLAQLLLERADKPESLPLSFAQQRLCLSISSARGPRTTCFGPAPHGAAQRVRAGEESH